MHHRFWRSVGFFFSEESVVLPRKPIKQSVELTATRRISLAVVVVALLSSCATPPRVSENRNPQSVADSLDRPYYGEASDAAKAAHINYRALMLRALRKDHAALRTLVHLSTNSHFDGAALEVHLTCLRDLLTVWGDRDFASAVGRFTREERRVWKSYYTFSDRASLLAEFPITSHLLYAPDRI